MIKALPVEQVAAPTAHLYLWCPNAMLPEGLAVMQPGIHLQVQRRLAQGAQGWRLDGRVSVSIPQRDRADPVRRARQERPDAGAGTATSEPAATRSEHSRKPDEQYDIIERAAAGRSSSCLRVAPQGLGNVGHQADDDYVRPGRPTRITRSDDCGRVATKAFPAKPVPDLFWDGLPARRRKRVSSTSWSMFPIPKESETALDLLEVGRLPCPARTARARRPCLLVLVLLGFFFPCCFASDLGHGDPPALAQTGQAFFRRSLPSGLARGGLPARRRKRVTLSALAYTSDARLQRRGRPGSSALGIALHDAMIAELLDGAVGEPVRTASSTVATCRTCDRSGWCGRDVIAGEAVIPAFRQVRSRRR